MKPLVPRRENSLERDTKRDRQIRLHIRMGLTASGTRHRLRTQCRGLRRSGVPIVELSQEMALRSPQSSIRIDGVQRVRMYRHLRNRQCDGCLATALALNVTLAEVYRHSPLQIRQRECRLSVTAVGRSEKRKQRLILIDRQKCTVA